MQSLHNAYQLFGFNSIFPQQKTMFNQYTKFFFIHCFENYKTEVTKTCKLIIRMSWNFDMYRLKDATIQKSYGSVNSVAIYVSH